MSQILFNIEAFVTSLSGIASIVVGAPVLWLVYRASVFLASPFLSPLRVIDGPPSNSYLFGNISDLVNGNALNLLRNYYEKYGHVFVIRTICGELSCVVADNRAIAHLLANNMTYHKPEFIRFEVSYLLGQGLISAEGLEHRYQRRIMMPTFSATHLRHILPIFISKSAELRDILKEQTALSTQGATVDMVHWLSRVTLDIIGLAGFNYEFHTLRDGHEGSELWAAFQRYKFSIWVTIKGFLPLLRIFDFDSVAQNARHVRKVVRKIGLQLIEEKQNKILMEKASAGGTDIEEKGYDHDLLSLMIRSNMSTTTPRDQRLSVSQILNQIPTFLLAGHETTSTALAWCLFALSQHPEVQSRLRNELLVAFPDEEEEMTVESINSLPYLEAVVRETSRFHPPLELSTRVAQEDDLIPLDHEFIGKDGKARTHIEVKKGDQFIIPVNLIHRSREIWGPDADQFNPGRWLTDTPAALSDVPGVWANLLTFLGGQRACIGFKFALLEMKVLLIHLIRTFEFELAVDPMEIVCREQILTRPFLRSEIEKGAQLPMIIRPVVSK